MSACNLYRARICTHRAVAGSMHSYYYKWFMCLHARASLAGAGARARVQAHTGLNPFFRRCAHFMGAACTQTPRTCIPSLFAAIDGVLYSRTQSVRRFVCQFSSVLGLGAPLVKPCVRCGSGCAWCSAHAQGTDQSGARVRQANTFNDLMEFVN